jgi:IMP dehydrogenase
MAKLRNGMALSFSDVLLVPQYNEIKSRLDVDLSTRLTRNIKIEIPILATNMSTVCELEMAEALWKSGSCGMIHRFMPQEKLFKIIDKATEIGIYPICISVGVKQEDCELVELLMKRENKPHIIIVDIAHADCLDAHVMVKFIKENTTNIDVIVGNIATSEACWRYCESDYVDAIRCGVGAGSCCTTRQISGSGNPTLDTIMQCYEIAKDYNIPLIGDGGFKTSGDCVKGLAFGCESITLGAMLASTSSSPGELVTENGSKKKKMYGMASKEGMIQGGKNNCTPEGITRLFDFKGNTTDVLNEILGGIRSGCTYSGASNLNQLREKSQYVIISSGGMIESKFV